MSSVACLEEKIKRLGRAEKLRLHEALRAMKRQWATEKEQRDAETKG